MDTDTGDQPLLPQDHPNHASTGRLSACKSIFGQVRWMARHGFSSVCNECDGKDRLSENLYWAAAVLMLQFGLIYMQSLVGKLIGHFYSALIDRSEANFLGTLQNAAMLLSGIAFCDALSSYCTDMLAVGLRRKFTRTLLHSYVFSSFERSYILENNSNDTFQSNQSIDNPDQRVAQESKLLSSSIAQVLKQGATAPVTIIYYSALAASVASWTAPVVVWCFFGVAAFGNRFAILRVRPVVVAQGEADGNLRSRLADVARDFQSVQLLSAQWDEWLASSKLLSSALKNQKILALRHFYVQLLSGMQAYWGSIVNYSVIALPLFVPSLALGHASLAEKHMSPGALAAAVSEASYYCLGLVNGFTILAQLSSQFSDMIGYCDRIREMIDAVSSHKFCSNWSKPNSREFSDGRTSIDMPFVIRVQGDLYAKGGANFKTEPLLRGIDLRVAHGENVLISGKSGAGKSTLLLALAGFHGGMQCRRLADVPRMAYVPQKPVLVRGSLLDNFFYGGNSTAQVGDAVDRTSVVPMTGDAESLCLKWLKLVGLDAHNLSSNCLSMQVHPSEGDCSSRGPAPSFFSGGEVQRLCIARALRQQPTLILLDEATCALPSKDEAELYQVITQAVPTVISVAHRGALKKFHNTLWRLDGNQVKCREIDPHEDSNDLDF